MMECGGGSVMGEGPTKLFHQATGPDSTVPYQRRSWLSASVQIPIIFTGTYTSTGIEN